ncbi:MAG TPA: hypothetical protein DD381_07025 [Lentisphaeria bacterium]|nr:MAG: hypothetical protein A2X47_10880 [Lentisphaerae bacterium GWF2_38_69]HBM16076.1 hypothetical protein [Lentisphaeria bacterium]
MRAIIQFMILTIPLLIFTGCASQPVLEEMTPEEYITTALEDPFAFQYHFAYKGKYFDLINPKIKINVEQYQTDAMQLKGCFEAAKGMGNIKYPSDFASSPNTLGYIYYKKTLDDRKILEGMLEELKANPAAFPAPPQRTRSWKVDGSEVSRDILNNSAVYQNYGGGTWVRY